MKWIPKLISLGLLWGAVALMIVFVEPDLIKDVVIPGSYLPFYLLVTLALWYSLALMTRTVGGSLVLTITLVGGMVGAMLHLMHGGLAIALLLTLVMESWYIYHRHEKIHTTNEQKNRDTSL